MAKIYLPKELLADGPATAMRGKIDSLRSEIESLTGEIEKLENSYRHLNATKILIENPLKTGTVEVRHVEEARKSVSLYEGQLEAMDAKIAECKKKRSALEAEESDLTKSFNSQYIEIEGQELI